MFRTPALKLCSLHKTNIHTTLGLRRLSTLESLHKIAGLNENSLVDKTRVPTAIITGGISWYAPLYYITDKNEWAFAVVFSWYGGVVGSGIGLLLPPLAWLGGVTIGALYIRDNFRFKLKKIKN